MALRHLGRRLSAAALRRASVPGRGPLVPLYRSSQGERHSDAFQDMEYMFRRSNNLQEERLRLFNIVQKKCRREMRLLNEEWDSFEKVVRRDLQGLARFNDRMMKVANLSAGVGVGAFSLAIGARCLM